MNTSETKDKKVNCIEDKANLFLAVSPQTCNLELGQEGVHLVARLVASLAEPLGRGKWQSLCLATKREREKCPYNID